MTERNATIVTLHVREGLNLSEIAAMYGITRERVRQIVKAHHGRTLTRDRWAEARGEKELARVRTAAEKRAYRNSLDFIRDRVKVDENGCWIWQLSRYPYGYGHLSWRGKGSSDYAHRVCWEIVHGPIPTDGPRLCVCHRCDVPACCNPAHLFLGTHKDNIQDSIAKGRFTQRFQKAAA